MNRSIWHWRNCRSIAVSFRFWLWPWGFGACRDDDAFGGHMSLFVGPLDFSIHYSIGNASAEHWWERAGAIHENESYERTPTGTGESRGKTGDTNV